MTSQHYDSAVLFVHGIGEQRRGATLEEFGGSLVDSARTWYGAGNVRDVSAELPVTSTTPDHRAVLVTRPGEAPMRVLLAESCWAEEVKAPRWGALMRWLASTVPFIVQRAVDGGMRRSASRLDATGGALNLVFSALRLVQNVFAVALSLLVLGGLFAVGLVARLSPIRKRLFDSATHGFPLWAYAGAVLTLIPIVLRLHHGTSSAFEQTALVAATALPAIVLLSLSDRLRSIVVGFIGDSYALLHADGSHNAIVHRVAADLSWLETAAGAAPVVVVAHSQGAEVARRALAGRAAGTAPLAGLVTFGAGIAKLDAVDKLRGQRRRSFAAFALRGLSAVCVCLAPVMFALVPDLAVALPAAAALLAGAAVALPAARREMQRIVGAQLDPRGLGLDDRQVAHWTDLHASHDLVSEGDLPVARCTRGFSRTIVNRRSMLLDHITYWRNVEGFQATIALEIERATLRHADTARPEALAQAQRVRENTIGRIDGARLAVAAVAPALWWHFEWSPLAAAIIAVAGAGLLIAVSGLLDLQATARTRALMTTPEPALAPPQLVAA
jgi:pimeloyl-ACP methyl ester carboxylesterase